jgi:restriction system protein
VSVWLVRAGRYGEREEMALNNNVAAIGWIEMQDMSSITSREELKDLLSEIYPDKKKMAIANNSGQLWIFLKKIQPGDLVIMPSKFRASIAIGKVKGTYEYRTDLSDNVKHTIPVEWLKTDIPRTAFDQDLLYSMGAFMTVCQIQRNDAENRINRVLKGHRDQTFKSSNGDDNIEFEEEEVDIEIMARDQIVDFVNHKFKGHDLSRLVEAVLQAQGYVTEFSKPGPDGGVDILAGSGPMGFEDPKICVQVKSSQSPADVTVLRGLQGTMSNFGANQGLLVSWGGFTKAVIDESRLNFFSIRLWDSDQLIKAIFKNYDKLSDSLQAELPLKRIWALVLGEE